MRVLTVHLQPSGWFDFNGQMHAGLWRAPAGLACSTLLSLSQLPPIMFKRLRSLWLKSARMLINTQRRQISASAKQVRAKPAKKITVLPAEMPLAAPSDRWRRASFMTSLADPMDGVVPGKRMDYWLYQPAGMTPGDTPLVVMLHGCEQTAVEFAAGTRMNRLADIKGFGVLYPQQSASAQSHRCWPWYQPEVQDGGAEASMIAAIMRRVVARYEFDPARVYVAGLSAGAAMAHIVALRYPRMVAAVGLHSGPIFGAASSSVGAYGVMQRGGLNAVGSAIDRVMRAWPDGFPAMPAMLIHGQQDTVVRPVNLHQLTLQFCRLNHLTAAHRQPHRYHPAGRTARAAHAFDIVDYRIGKKILLRTCEILQLDHAWSGGDAQYRFNARRGPDAGRMLWQFFAPHSRLLQQAASVSVTPGPNAVE